MTDRLCPKHEPRVAACIVAAHLDAEAATRLRADYGRACTPGEHWCPPFVPIDTQEKP